MRARALRRRASRGFLTWACLGLVALTGCDDSTTHISIGDTVSDQLDDTIGADGDSVVGDTGISDADMADSTIGDTDSVESDADLVDVDDMSADGDTTDTRSDADMVGDVDMVGMDADLSDADMVSPMTPAGTWVRLVGGGGATASSTHVLHATIGVPAFGGETSGSGHQLRVLLR